MLRLQWNMWHNAILPQSYLHSHESFLYFVFICKIVNTICFKMFYIFLCFSNTVVYWSVWYICFLQQSPEDWNRPTVSVQYQFSHVGNSSSCCHYFLLLLPLWWHEVIFKVSKHAVISRLSVFITTL